MNPILSLAGVFLAACLAVGNAFTMAFAGDTGAGLPQEPLVLDVPGYGGMRFDSANGSALVIGNGTEGESHDSGAGHALRVTFVGADPKLVDFDCVGMDGRENIVMRAAPEAVTRGGGRDAGALAMSAADGMMATVPEPLAAWLGSLGAGLLVLRRKR